MKIINSSEKGQILVLLVLVLMGLLGFTALAIDGGMIYADRRYMQSAADASSLAGASSAAQYIEDNNYTTADFNCSLGIVPGMLAAAEDVAQQKAIKNDFDDIKTNDELGTSVFDYGIMATCDSATNNVEVLVKITKQTNTSFIQVITGEPMKNTVTSIGEAEPGFNAGGGAAIISTSFECGTNKGGVHIDGTPRIEINVGGIFSNSCAEFKGTTYVDVKSGKIEYYKDSYWLKSGNCPHPEDCLVSPEPTPAEDYHPITYENIPAPVCLAGSETNVTVGTGNEATLNPGNFGSIRITGKGKITLNPGLYCISEEITVNDGTFIGEGVTIYYTNTTPSSGDGIFITGGDIKLLAQNLSPNTVTPSTGVAGLGAIEDMLIYLGRDSDARVELKGNGGSVFGGTVYAPSSNIFIGGTPNLDSGDDTVTYATSIIGYDVTVSGTANLNITYEKDMDYGVPASMQQKQ
jgi:Flp pilus assembly protein TadG